MANLIFLDEGHKYQLDGEVLPSVSELTRFITREVYGDVSQFTLDNAACRGTAVHKATEVLDKYGKAEIDEEYVDYLKSYVCFRKEHKCSWDEIERAFHHPEYLYAGTIDRYTKDLDGEPAIVDLKTTSVLQKRCATAQLSLYKMMLEANGYEVKKTYILHLMKDGTYKLVEIPFNEDVAKACITLNDFMKKKTRRSDGRKQK